MARISASMRVQCAKQLRDNIIFIMLRARKTHKDVADYMGMTEKTWRKKLDDPQKLCADEFITLGNFFNVSPDLIWAGRFQVPKLEVPEWLK